MWSGQLMTQVSKHFLVCLSWCIILVEFCIYSHTETSCSIVLSSLLAHRTKSWSSFQDHKVTITLLSLRTPWDYFNRRESSRDGVMGQASGLSLANKSTQFQCWKRIQCGLCKKGTTLCHLHSSHAILQGKQDPNSSISWWSVESLPSCSISSKLEIR